MPTGDRAQASAAASRPPVQRAGAPAEQGPRQKDHPPDRIPVRPRSGAALPQAHAFANPDNVLLRNVFAQDQPQEIHIISPGKNYLPGSRG